MATTNSPSAYGASDAKAEVAANDAERDGLSSEKARRLLQRDGSNAMPDTTQHPLRRAVQEFWAPVPWMLEAAIVLERVLGKYVEAVTICR